MTVSDEGLDLIKSFEGCRLTAYRDAAGVWTIGYGHTGPDVVPGGTITQQEADALLQADVNRFASGVEALVEVPMTQEQFDALVSFAYNIGLSAFGQSTLLRLLNAEDYDGAANQFQRWVHGGGKVLPGLVRRREAEAELFRTKETTT